MSTLTVIQKSSTNDQIRKSPRNISIRVIEYLAQAAAPEDLPGDQDHHDPAGLDRQQASDGGGIVDAAGDQGHGEVHLVEVGQVGRELVQPRRQQIQREDLAAEERLDRHRQDDQPLDLEEPEAEQPENVGDAELDEARHDERRHERRVAPPVVRQDEVLVDQRIDHDQRQQDEQAGDKARGQIDTEAVAEVVHRLRQELVDQAVADVLADLVVLVEGTDEKLYDNERDEVG